MKSVGYKSISYLFGIFNAVLREQVVVAAYALRKSHAQQDVPKVVEGYIRIGTAR